MRSDDFGWGRIARLGLVQAALGAIVVLTTSTLNRVMVVELALPALLPGVLVALHYLVQISRPRMGHGSDVGGRRTPWIVGGMALLAASGVVAALATVWMGTNPVAGTLLAMLGFAGIGLGVSASGTSLLVLLAKRVRPDRRAGAATLVWLMMIVGFAVTAGVAGKLLDPYSPARLLAVCSGVSVLALLLTLAALAGLEGRHAGTAQATDDEAPVAPGEFKAAMQAVWADARARRFAIFVFVSMLAYSAQDLILEPFAGAVMGYTPGQSTSLSGVQHGGVLVGMLMAAAAGRSWRGRRFGTLRGWTVGGCIASALAMAGLVVSGLVGQAFPFKPTVFVLGMANGAFSIAAIGSMMQLATEGTGSREGVRMGLWGAAQAIAFGLGGLIGTGMSDLSRLLFASPGAAYASVFALEGAMFLVAARIAARSAAAGSAATGPARADRPPAATPMESSP
ncbi:BCD family MFS transporter [Ideonella sp. A 288]|uniref:BCD family MFS transporter n=1 Tax=Ideonella sp. A 288 TaxID=1962181 RepID=UPI000B4A6139|nr:BCD family MFS transporter [Ideonella sp. A 288]